MALSLSEYVVHLDAGNRPWPAAPTPVPAKVRPHVSSLGGIRAVTWTVYGTLLSITEGELKFESSSELMMTVALEKTIHEFKMWGSMSRKPGQPSEYMKEIYRKAVDEQRMAPSPGEKNPEIAAEKIWESIVKKLFQKEYKFDAGFYGPIPEYCKKIAYFFHAGLQGTGCYPGAVETMRSLSEAGIIQGLLGDGQCFTAAQLSRGMRMQETGADLDQFVAQADRILSFDRRARKPSDTMFQAAVDALSTRGIEAEEILHVGSNLTRDIAPAKKWGMKTALFAADRTSLSATADLLRDPAHRPDALLTELNQVLQLL